jgi:hypothetical protein
MNIQNSFHFNGKTWFYDNETEFLIEIGRYLNSYQNHKKFNNIDDAIKYYNAYLISDGYKKRLSMVTNDKKTIIAYQLTKKEGI